MYEYLVGTEFINRLSDNKDLVLDGRPVSSFFIQTLAIFSTQRPFFPDLDSVGGDAVFASGVPRTISLEELKLFRPVRPRTLSSSLCDKNAAYALLVEYAEGISLAEFAQIPGNRTAVIAHLRSVYKLLSLLYKLYNFVDSDLNATNVIICKDGVKIIDYGRCYYSTPNSKPPLLLRNGTHSAFEAIQQYERSSPAGWFSNKSSPPPPCRGFQEIFANDTYPTGPKMELWMQPVLEMLLQPPFTPEELAQIVVDGDEESPGRKSPGKKSPGRKSPGRKSAGGRCRKTRRRRQKMAVDGSPKKCLQ